MMRTNVQNIRPPCYKIGDQAFGVPSFYPYNHRETFWIINMMKESNWKTMRTRMCLNPGIFRNSYYQLPDIPSSGDPVFHKKAILYLTVAGIAVYFGDAFMLKQLVTCSESQISECKIDVNEPCFVTNLKEKDAVITDIHAIYPFCIAIRCSRWETIPFLLEGGWIPHESFKLPYRKLCCAFNLSYCDGLDYFLGQLITRPSLHLAKFIRTLTRAHHQNFVLRTCLLQKKKISDSQSMDDLLSMPRRLLRFMNDQDPNFRFGGKILQGVRVLVEEMFFEGPTGSTKEISMDGRHKVYKNGFKEDNYYTRTVYDQDCCIALLLGYITRTEMRGFSELNKKTISLLLLVLTHTRWLLRFLDTDAETLADYFLSIGENTEISGKSVRSVRAVIPEAYRLGQIHDNYLDPDLIDLKGDVAEQMIAMGMNVQDLEDEETVHNNLLEMQRKKAKRMASGEMPSYATNSNSNLLTESKRKTSDKRDVLEPSVRKSDRRSNGQRSRSNSMNSNEFAKHRDDRTEGKSAATSVSRKRVDGDGALKSKARQDSTSFQSITSLTHKSSAPEWTSRRSQPPICCKRGPPSKPSHRATSTTSSEGSRRDRRSSSCECGSLTLDSSVRSSVNVTDTRTRPMTLGADSGTDRQVRSETLGDKTDAPKPRGRRARRASFTDDSARVSAKGKIAASRRWFEGNYTAADFRRAQPLIDFINTLHISPEPLNVSSHNATLAEDADDEKTPENADRAEATDSDWCDRLNSPFPVSVDDGSACGASQRDPSPSDKNKDSSYFPSCSSYLPFSYRELKELPEMDTPRVDVTSTQEQLVALLSQSSASAAEERSPGTSSNTATNCGRGDASSRSMETMETTLTIVNDTEPICFLQAEAATPT